MSTQQFEYPVHDLAAIFPLMDDKSLQKLSDSIKVSGLREPIVLLDGKILDGRNREAAARKAGVAPRYRDFNPTADGGSPARFVADRNLHHRHLTPAQAAAVAEELVYHYQQEAMTKTEATSAAAAALNVSARSVHTAAAIKEADPGTFEKVKAGEVSLDAGLKEAKAKKAAAEPAPPAEDTAPLRKKHGKEVRKQLGEEFGDAFETGVALADSKHLHQFIDMAKEDRKLVAQLVFVKKWEPKRALAFMSQKLTGDNRIKDLVEQTRGTAKGDTIPKVFFEGWVVTCRKAAEGEG